MEQGNDGMSIVQSIKNFSIKMRDIGIPEDMPPEEAKHVKLLNSIYILSALLTGPGGVISSIQKGWIAYLIVHSSMILSQMLGVYLNHLGRFTLSRVWYAISNITIMVLVTALNDKELISYYIFFIFPLAFVLVFPKKETKLMYAMLGLDCVAFILASFINASWEPVYEWTPKEIVDMNNLVLLYIALIIFLISLLSRMYINQAEERTRQVNLELDKSNRELKKIDEMKDSFLSMVSHDLRTPMTSIQGYASLLKEKSDLGKERRIKYLGVIVKESVRLTRLIDDLLDLQRFEAGRMNLNMEDFDLIDALEESAGAFQGAVFTKNITLKKDLPGGQIIINADRDRMLQVLANLLSNAIKFTPEQGTITLSAERVSVNEKPGVKVSVADTGPGIPEDQQTTLFEKFRQVKDGTISKEKGSGLGLALVREIIEHHQGKVGVESRSGDGSIFYFTLQMVPMKN
jgi:signal transduction histidine kinase